MNILLTGGTGYIGSHTAVVLTEAGHEVILYDNLSNSSPDVIQRLKEITGKHPSFVQGDVRDTELLGQTLRTNRIEAVIHFAGLKAVGESTVKPIEYFENNVEGTISLLRGMQANGVKRLVFSSSATVYGNPKYLPIDEEHPTDATNPYGRTKLHIEEMLCDLADSEASWRITSLRYFNPVGAHESGLIGESPNGIPNNLMPYVAQVATGRLPHLKIFGNDYSTPDGTGVRDYIHVMDLAEGHLASLKYLGKQSSAFSCFNLGTSKGFSVLEVVEAFEAASGKSIPYQIAPRRSGDVAACYAKVDKARSVLSWQATRSLEEMCSSMWRWQTHNTSLIA